MSEVKLFTFLTQIKISADYQEIERETTFLICFNFSQCQVFFFTFSTKISADDQEYQYYQERERERKRERQQLSEDPAFGSKRKSGLVHAHRLRGFG